MFESDMINIQTRHQHASDRPWQTDTDVSSDRFDCRHTSSQSLGCLRKIILQYPFLSNASGCATTSTRRRKKESGSDPNWRCLKRTHTEFHFHSMICFKSNKNWSLFLPLWSQCYFNHVCPVLSKLWVKGISVTVQQGAIESIQKHH